MKSFSYKALLLLMLPLFAVFTSCDEEEVTVKSVEIMEAPGISIYMSMQDTLHLVYTPTVYDNVPFVVWESDDESIATVGLVTGIVTPQSEGQTTIRVTVDKRLTATCLVTVKAINAENITLDTHQWLADVDEQLQLNANIYPAIATSSSLLWQSSNDEVATVDDKGVVTAVGTGDCVIKVTNQKNEVEDSCVVKVNPIRMKSLELSLAEVERYIGEDFSLTASFAPLNSADTTILWASSDSTIAQVADSGLIKCIGVGECDIIICNSDSSLTASCHVTVKPILMESLIFTSDKVSVERLHSTQVGFVITPDNTTFQDLIWTSSDEEVATIDSHGVVTGHKLGQCVIEANNQERDKHAYCILTVTPLVAKTVIMSRSSYDLLQSNGGTLKLEAFLKIDTIKDVIDDNTTIWTSSDPNIATVDEDGLVTGKNEGTAMVYAASGHGIDSCAITVKSIQDLVTCTISTKAKDETSFTGTALFMNKSAETISINSYQVLDAEDNVILEKALASPFSMAPSRAYTISLAGSNEQLEGMHIVLHCTCKGEELIIDKK